MAEEVADLVQRERALTPNESFIVQAPAGSGKTELLIQRYLRLLAAVDSPEEIIAITFTRKAAAEMRGRIIQALEASGQPAADAAAGKTVHLAQQANACNQKHDWQLASNPGRLRIQTIDSLCAFLTRQMPLLAGFGAQPETLDDASEIYLLAAANTLAELESGTGWSDSIAVLLAHLDNDLPRVRNMLSSMLARRDQWLRHIAKQHQRKDLETAIQHLVETELHSLVEIFPDEFKQELLELLRFAAANLDEQGESSPYRACHDIQHFPGATVESLPVWQGITRLLLTGTGSWRKRADARTGFPAACADKSKSERRKTMKDRFAALLSRLSVNDDLHSQLAEVSSLPQVTYTDNEWQVVDALYQLLILADAQLRLLFAENSRIDFSGIEQAAILALGETDAPTDLALHLDYQVKHILVDEFQDISVNQYVLLERLTAGWSGQDGHTLFLVGDPMQSIYRFREAEVGMFLNTWQQERLGQVPITPINISVNFRSEADIVEWVNNTFGRVLPATADIVRGAVNYVYAEAFHQQSAANPVRIHPLYGRDDIAEAELVLSLINAAQMEYTSGKTAVLVRNRNHLNFIVPLLKQTGLRFRAVEIEALGTRPAIQDLLALTRTLHHFADRIAWLAMLRAPWCGLSLVDLYAVAGESRDTSIWECMFDKMIVQSLSAEGQERLIRIRNVLEQAFSERGRRRMARWVESVWMALGGPATLTDETDLENVQTFFQLLEQFDQGGMLRDRESFMEQVASLYAAADTGADDSLQIMTIHKAKGLEFDTIILPGLHRSGASDDAGLLLWMERPHGMHQDLLLAPVKQAGVTEAPIYNYLRKLEKEKRHFEEGRLLYVAVTRAKKQLHIIASVDVKTSNTEVEVIAPNKNTLLAHLWPVIDDEIRDRLEVNRPRTSVTTDIAVDINNRLKRLHGNWRRPDPPAPLKWKLSPADDLSEPDRDRIEYIWAGETIMHIGSVAHRYIQQMAVEGIEIWDQSRIRANRHNFKLALQGLGVMKHELEEAAARVEEALIKMIQDERGQWILSGTHREQHNEYAVTGVYNGRIINTIIDRTFVDIDGVRWIVDYKTSRHEGADIDTFLDRELDRYKEQLERYGILMAGLDNRPVRLGLYFPLLQGWREWEFNR